MKIVLWLFSLSLSLFERTALHAAAHHGFNDIVVHLLDAGAAINVVNGAGRTPILAALKKCHVSIAETLISRGADINLIDSTAS